jgi:hypothetical protein
MPRVAPVVPAETDLLCEQCGYTLNGLPETGNCPECGDPISNSLGHERAAAEVERDPTVRALVATTAQVITRPRAFYRTLATRRDSMAAAHFANVHRIIAGALFGLAAAGHVSWLAASTRGIEIDAGSFVVLLASAGLLSYAALRGVTALAGWLSAIEARYWGMRLPHAIVKRGLAFHSAAYLPVGLLAVTVVWGHLLLLDNHLLDFRADTYYLYTLCGLVIVSAIYLFQMYWIAMRNMRYANR